MTTPLRDTWSELIGETGPAPVDIRLRLVFSGADVRAFAAVTAKEGLPAVLLELPDAVRPRNFKTLITRAFQMSAPSVKGLPSGRWALLIELKDRTFQDLFEVLVGDVLIAIHCDSGNQATLRAVLLCIDRWRRFVERKGEPLSDEEVQGLIGELVVLSRCARCFGADVALAAWTGPDRALRDFELPDTSVEVKTYQGGDAATVLISSPAQLDAVAMRPVYLAAVRLTLSDAQGLTLSEFVGRALSVIGPGTASDGVLEERLVAAGYLAAHAPLYVKRFIAGPVMTYAVTPGFPRIRSIDVPQGVSGVRFALSIPALAPFQAAAVAVIGGRIPELESL
ncbi:MAG: PD-(D/E)XK motif protein [Gammaproteobacteria bacterium]|nr:PD-(D/E)XK motif protein [Gammaproteobacteria bacterium]